MGSPIPRLPYGQVGQSAAGGILEWLKQRFMQQMAGQGGGMPFARGVPGIPAAGRGGVPPVTPDRNPAREAAPMTKDSLEAGREAGIPSLLPSHGAPGIPDLIPSHGETAPPATSPLSFSWGREKLQPYDEGRTNILEMKGAPEGRSGFLGLRPSDPSRAGGYVFGAEENIDPITLRERAEADRLRREREDPYHRERALAKIEADAQYGLAQRLGEQELETATELRIELEERLKQEIEKKELEYGRPLSPDERDDILNFIWKLYRNEAMPL